MSDNLKQLAPVIWEEIQKAKKILLSCHLNPDLDSIGSSLALYLMLKNLHKDAVLIYGDSKKKQQYTFIPGFEEVLEKSFLETNLESFDLFIACDSAGLEQLSQLTKIVFPPHLSVINIDHHPTNTKYGRINLIEPDAPACAQIVYELLQEWQTEITPEIAINLFLGIYADTGGFKYPKTSPETFLAASKLSVICPNFADYIFTLENSYEPEQIKFLGLALSSVENYFQGKVAVASISLKALQKTGIQAKHTEKMEIANILKSAVGWEIGISLVEVDKNKCNLSLRTRNCQKYDLSKLATALGGGGHSAAAGSTIYLPLSEAKKLLLKKIGETFPELEK